MKYIVITFLLASSALAQDKLVKEITLSRSDLILSEKITALMKVSGEGYFNPTLTKQVKTEIAKSKHFSPFSKWVNGIDTIHGMKSAQQLSLYCHESGSKVSELPLEKLLDQRLNHFCREKALELIGREIDKNNTLPDYAHSFIKNNLKYLLKKSHLKSFSYFLQNQDNRPEILKKISADITEYSIKNQISPSHEILQDILIDDKITSLIQAKGLQPLEHKNVFYTEFGKLIEEGYKILNATEVDAKKLAKHIEHLK